MSPNVTVEGIREQFAAEIRETESTPPPISALDVPTDLDAACRLVEAHSADIRHASGLGWLAWDGRRWALSEARVKEFAKVTARAWSTLAFNSFGEGRERRLKAAMALENAGRIAGAVKLAESDPRVRASVAAFDADPWRLNVENGTLCLRTAELAQHTRDDFITKCAPVRFEPDATHPALDKFLATLRAVSPELPGFLARAFGCALTGDASVESLFLLQGAGGGGKTTLTEAFAAMVGEYAVKLPFESFCLSKHGRSPGAASPDLVRLRGARFAFAAEGDSSARFDAGTVKSLTGNEAVTARALFQPPITFLPTWKLWLVSNFDPRADAEDSGLWRRIVKVTFPAIAPEHRDPAIKRELVEDPAARSALLAWALAGCMDWQEKGGGRSGLAIPGDVEAATDAYRHAQDTLGQWLAEVLDEGGARDAFGTATVTEVRSHYEGWCRDSGATPCQPLRFNKYLEKQGFMRSKGTAGMRIWRGLRMP